jgi:two-component system chemotaxis response regulator CheB
MTKRNIIVVGASTGGVETLCELNKHLPAGLDASVFVVMHIGTVTMLPKILSRCGNLPAVTAEDGKRYERGCIYCAPAQCHLSLKDHVTVLTRGPRENGHRPAVDVLFRSAARAHRSKVVGVVLSGWRDDGSAGLYAIKARGGIAIVQDPNEAVTPNMPQNSLDMVDIDFCLPIRQIAGVLVQLTNGKTTNITESSNGGNISEDQATADRNFSSRLEESITTAKNDLKLLRDILDRI